MANERTPTAATRNPSHGEPGHVHGPDCGHAHHPAHGEPGHVHGPHCNHDHGHHGHHHHGHQAPLLRSGPKIGRNDACPCGSGKKYKKCCLAA